MKTHTAYIQVPCSEKLPAMETYVTLVDNIWRYRQGNFFIDNGVEKLSIAGTETYKSFVVQKEHFHHYWWLEKREDVIVMTKEEYHEEMFEVWMKGEINGKDRLSPNCKLDKEGSRRDFERICKS